MIWIGNKFPDGGEEDMVLNVLSHPRKLDFYRNSNLFQNIFSSDPRQLKNLRILYRSVMRIKLMLDCTPMSGIPSTEDEFFAAFDGVNLAFVRKLGSGRRDRKSVV